MEQLVAVHLTRSQLVFLDILLANSDEKILCELRPHDYAKVVEKVHDALETIVADATRRADVSTDALGTERGVFSDLSP